MNRLGELIFGVTLVFAVVFGAALLLRDLLPLLERMIVVH